MVYELTKDDLFKLVEKLDDGNSPLFNNWKEHPEDYETKRVGAYIRKREIGKGPEPKIGSLDYYITNEGIFGSEVFHELNEPRDVAIALIVERVERLETKDINRYNITCGKYVIQQTDKANSRAQKELDKIIEGIKITPGGKGILRKLTTSCFSHT